MFACADRAYPFRISSFPSGPIGRPHYHAVEPLTYRR